MKLIRLPHRNPARRNPASAITTLATTTGWFAVGYLKYMITPWTTVQHFVKVLNISRDSTPQVVRKYEISTTSPEKRSDGS